MAEIDFIARAPPHNEVEELSKKQIMKALKNKMPVEQYTSMYGMENGATKDSMQKKDDKNGSKNHNSGKNNQKKEEKKSDSGGNKKEKEEEKRKRLTPQQEKFYEMLRDMSGKKKARLLNSKGGIVTEVSTGELINVLDKEKKSVNAIVFDGVITQRLVDTAYKKGVKMIVGTKMGNVAKLPSSISVWTKKDFE